MAVNMAGCQSICLLPQPRAIIHCGWTCTRHFTPPERKRSVHFKLPAMVHMLLVLAAWSYIAGILLWVSLHMVAGDRWWWLFLLNALAHYLFLPAVLLPPLALLTRQPLIGLGATALALIWLGWFGQLYLPQVGTVAAQTPPLSVLTYNTLYHNTDTARTITTIRASDADVVAVQELNAATIQALVRELSDAYPYQVIAPDGSTGGMGLLSRYPLTALPDSVIEHLMPGGWIGSPQLVQLDFAGRSVLLLHIHAASTNLGYGGPLRFDPATITSSVRRREAQMHAIAAFARSRPEPLLVLGDFNTGYPSHAHHIISAALQDAWLAAGFGQGHTFPGANIPGSSRPTILGQPVPQWLIRLDYIFYSAHWQASRAWLPAWDGGSDHRPVQAELHLR